MRSGRVTVDGVSYQWTVTSSAELNPEGSLDFGYRFDFDESAEITDGRSLVRFDTPLTNYLLLTGWWMGPPAINNSVVERAVRIARSRTTHTHYKLDSRETWTALRGPTPTVEDDLVALGRALAGLPGTAAAFISATLAVACRHWEPGDVPVAIADFIASHANALVAARGALQALCNGADEATRSAFEFLHAMCAHMNVDLGIDTTAADARLRAGAPYQCRPWRVPGSHWWWREPRDSDDND